MALGQNTYWIIVDLEKREAECPKNDKRAALRFVDEIAAKNWCRGQFPEPRWVVVKVAA